VDRGQQREIQSQVNNRPATLATRPETLLVDALRDGLGLKGTKKSCELSVCGSCTVLIDGDPFSSCMTLATEIEGKDVTTVEGLATGDELSDVQLAFAEEGAIQCGFCTPGFTLAAHALLDRHPDADRATIVRFLAGNICRCTGYDAIFRAVERVRDARMARADSQGAGA
jgi:carbon-monoxide dehydrogenase small subunit